MDCSKIVLINTHTHTSRVATLAATFAAGSCGPRKENQGQQQQAQQAWRLPVREVKTGQRTADSGQRTATATADRRKRTLELELEGEGEGEEEEEEEEEEEKERKRDLSPPPPPPPPPPPHSRTRPCPKARRTRAPC